MKKVLITGASGYLGKYVVREFKRHGYWIRAFVRDPDKLSVEGGFLEPRVDELVDDIWVGDVTRPDTLKGLCNDIDIVFSSIGLTNPKERVSFNDVDYIGNKNILDEALRSSVEKFIYISVFGGRELTYLDNINAKEKFVEMLRASGLEHVVIRPTGFYSDMTQFLMMALKGRIYLIGNGESRINPIHGEDLARVCVHAVNQDRSEIPVGGPEVFQYIDIARLAFEVIGKKPKITRIPKKFIELFIIPMKMYNRNYYTLIRFFTAAMSCDFIAPSTGVRKLRDYFEEILRVRSREI